MYIKSYKELIVWQKSIDLAKEIYKLTESFPKNEIYGLSSQIRRSAVSVPSNIAEGYGRRTQKEFTQFLAIAYGSLLELETQLILSKQLYYSQLKNYLKPEMLITEISKMLNSMINKFKLNAKR